MQDIMKNKKIKNLLKLFEKIIFNELTSEKVFKNIIINQ